MGKYKILSLFSGAGGMDLGFEAAGIKKIKNVELINDKELFKQERKNGLFEIVWVNDMNKDAIHTYKTNFESKDIVEGDIRKISEFPKVDIVLGGFPCPGFSISGPRRKDDPRNTLYLEFIRVLHKTKPKIFVAENVKGILSLDEGRVFKKIISDFNDCGYNINYKLLNAADFHVPQNRERVFIIGTRKDIKKDFHFPKGNGTKVSLQDSIKDLENDYGDIYEGDFSSMYLSRNRKKTWDDVSFTIQASGRHAPLHPSGPKMVKQSKDVFSLDGGNSKNRRLSVKEVARIQTFPDWFVFTQTSNKRNKNGKVNAIYKQIGNAVPVYLAFHLGKSVINFLTN